MLNLLTPSSAGVPMLGKSILYTVDSGIPKTSTFKTTDKRTATNKLCWHLAAALYTLGAASVSMIEAGNYISWSFYDYITCKKNVTALILCGHADEMSESRQTHVTLHDIDPQALEQLVQYAYTAEIVVGEGNVQVISDKTFYFIPIHHKRHNVQQTPSTFLDVASSSEPTAAQRGAGRLL